MGRRSTQIRERMGAIQASLTDLKNKEDPNDDDATRTEDLLTEWDQLTEELEPLAAQEKRIEAAQRAWQESQGNRESSDPGTNPDGTEVTPPAAVRTGAPDLVVRNRNRNPYTDLESVRAHMVPVGEMRGRAEQVIESFAARNDQWWLNADGAEHATKLVTRSGKQFSKALAEHIVITSSPDYLAAFESYLNDPGGAASRAALSLTSANGGYLVPFTLDPTIILTNAGSANPYRQYATIKTTTTNDWNGVTSAGVNAEWTAEGTEAADASPTVGQLKITPQKADAYLFGSFEVLSDSDFAVQLPDLLADAKDRIEETAFSVGTGTGQPKGVIVAGTSQNRAGTAAAGPAAQDVYSLQQALPARWRGPRARNVWLANLNTINTLRNVPAFSGATTSIVNDNTTPPTMLGKPFVEATSIVGVFTTGSKVLAYADLSQYYIVDRVGMSVVYDPIVLGSNRRPTGQGAWYAFWRVGADASTATAIRVFATLT
jgi:HK97 family phage major capsid protein